MFDQNQKNAYLNIKAPLQLKNRVLSAAQTCPANETVKRNKNFSSALKRLTVVAACLVLVLTASVVIFRNGGNTSFYVDGQKLTGDSVAVRTANEGLARAFSLEEESVTVKVPVEMKLKGKAQINISQGAVIKDGEHEPTAVPFEAEGNLKLEWVVDSAAQGTVYTLTVKVGDLTETLILEYGQEVEGWEVRLERLD